MRRVVGVDGLTVSIYLNLNDVNDPKNYDIQIPGSGLTENANVNTLDISGLDTTISSGFLARYTKSESIVRYYTKTEIDTDIKTDVMLLVVVVLLF